MNARRGARAVAVAVTLVMVGSALAGCSVASDLSAGPTTDAELVAAVSLTAEDMAEGSTIQLVPEGDKVQGTVSLDLCFAQYPSEELRMARHQVVSGRESATDLWVSSEALLYATPQAADQAMGELARARSACPADEVTSEATGASATWQFQAPPDADWPTAAGVARQAYAFTITSEDDQSTGTATYLQRGRMLLALYVNPPDAAADIIRNAPDPARFTEVMTHRMLALPEDELNQSDPDAPEGGGLDA